MKRFSAQYIITNSGPILKRGVVTADDEGTILSIDDTSGELEEKHSLEFHNGIIIPGFVNCHCHLELSHMKGIIPRYEGLPNFIEQIRITRVASSEKILIPAYSADMDMYRNGISLCADICNTADTFCIKKESKIRYINLIEVFGIDPDKAIRRMNEAAHVSAVASAMNLANWLVPHSVYSMSLPLLRLLLKESSNNKVTSLHFMETSGEIEFLENHSGPLITSYEKTGLLPKKLVTPKDHADAVLNEITDSGNLILVHNTFADADTIRKVKKRSNLFFCLCPESNLYIEKKLPPIDLLSEEGCEIVIGTDSLSSNNKLDILGELITLQLNFPSVSLNDLVRWATVNGARALGEEGVFGSIEPGKKPGLLLLEGVDLQNMKLTQGSFVTRLV